MSLLKGTILTLLVLFGLIFYDAAQQKFYLDMFELAPKSDYSLGSLFIQHLIRWGIWLLISAPFGIMAWRAIKSNPRQFDTAVALRLAMLILTSILISLVVISLATIGVQSLSLDAFGELFTFFFFQKSLLFFMADCTILILFYSYSRELVIQSQYVAIENYKQQNQDESAKAIPDIPQMLIRTGNRITPVLLEEIVWIQSDDYCSKIHTSDDKSFSLRKSLKSLEAELRPYGFVRIHRSALLNLKSVEQLSLDRSVVRLQNHVELPVSKSRVKSLKESLSEQSL